MNSSKKVLNQALKECLFDPRKPSSMTTIVSSNKVEYLTERAQEILHDVGHFSGAEKTARLRDAIGILAYAMTLIPPEVFKDQWGFGKQCTCLHRTSRHSADSGRCHGNPDEYGILKNDCPCNKFELKVLGGP